MKEKEIRDDENTTWKCVQAFSLANGQAARDAEKISSNDGSVEVICTPSGGGKTVRLSVSEGWEESMSDEDLKNQINRNRSWD